MKLQTPGILGVDVPPYKARKNEKYMSKKMSNHFQNILQTLKQQLIDQVNSTVNNLKSADDFSADENDRASQEQLLIEEINEKRRLALLVKKVHRALVSLEKGSYGYCDICGEDIGLRRLEARPTATLCIDCKTLAEIQEKQRGQ